MKKQDGGNVFNLKICRENLKYKSILAKLSVYQNALPGIIYSLNF